MTEQVSTQSTKVFASAQLLANSLANIQTKYAFSINSMTANAGYLKTAQTSIDKFSTSVLDGAFSELIYFIQGVLALILVCSILILFGVLATHYLDIYSCKTCVQLGWILYGLLYFGILALCFIFFALGGISYTFCKFYGGLVNNNTQLSIYSTSTTPTPFSHLFQTISPCFSGNGSIGQSFSLTSETQTVNSLYANINTLLNMQDSTKSVYVNLNYSTDKITGWVNAMKQYEAGIYVDAPSSVTSEDNPYVALGNMNKYADNGTGGAPPTCTFDYWVFDKANCTHNSTESIYAASPTSGTAFVSTGFMCISFN
jgi:ABC-type multidrug transport system fused ATPase/permease subunit